MHAAEQLTGETLLALITGLIVFVVVAYLIFRKKRPSKK